MQDIFRPDIVLDNQKMLTNNNEDDTESNGSDIKLSVMDDFPKISKECWFYLNVFLL